MIGAMTDLGDRLRAARKKAAMTQKKLAGLIGVERATISQWEIGQHLPGRDSLLSFAEHTGVRVDDLVKDEINDNHAEMPLADQPKVDMINTESEVRVADVPEPLPRSMPKNVPVFGAAAGATEGEFILNGEISEYIRRPPGVENAPHVFAIWVAGDSMAPRYFDGELIYVHPGRRCAPGDFVVIELTPTEDGSRPAFVKRLIRRTADSVIVEQLNPQREIIFPAKLVGRLLRILTTRELMGL